jgi:phosphatidylserine/phosphatidylglycerophosphate/cardiolipin synthase-like enzyme
MLQALAGALSSGAVTPPYLALSVRRFVPPDLVASCSEELALWAQRGLAPTGLADLLRLIARERSARREQADHVELVWSGPETTVSVSRDTAVVVRELFASARQSVLVSGYAVRQGKRVFHELAANLDAHPQLQVRMFLNVQREPHDGRSDDELIRNFAERFRTTEWPGVRLPVVHFDPRALAAGPGVRSCLHAKCVVVDGVRALVTSANFTEAAQERNFEAGVLIESAAFATALTNQFETLVAASALPSIAELG